MRKVYEWRVLPVVDLNRSSSRIRRLNLPNIPEEWRRWLEVGTRNELGGRCGPGLACRVILFLVPCLRRDDTFTQHIPATFNLVSQFILTSETVRRQRAVGCPATCPLVVVVVVVCIDRTSHDVGLPALPPVVTHLFSSLKRDNWHTRRSIQTP